MLQRRTGDREARRSTNACACRADQLGVPSYQGEMGEMSLEHATRVGKLPNRCYLYQAAHDGRLPTVKRGKQRYVNAADWEVWLTKFRAREAAEQQALKSLPEETISKVEAMALTGLGETHLTRYLQTGVIRAWKIPDKGEVRPRGYWRVSVESCRQFVEARASGRLGELLNENPAYVMRRQDLTAQIRQLRRAGRVQQRDPLMTPRSRYHPGCFTIAQLASHVGLSAQVVYEAIPGNLKAVTMVRGGRLRYAVEPEEARRYAQWVAERGEAAARWHNRRRRAILEAGLLTLRDLEERWHVEEWKASKMAKNIPHRQWGRYLVFEVKYVEAFEALRDST